MSKLSRVITKWSIILIPENAILDRIVRELRGREMFVDADEDLGERIYSGDVFEAILNEFGEMEDTPMYPPKNVMEQLVELRDLIDTEYVQITML